MKNSISILLLFIGFLSFPQEENKNQQEALRESKNLTWEANKELSENNFVDAEVDYRKAIAKSDENPAAPYNLGNAYYNKETYSEAFGRFKQAGELATDKKAKHNAYHNMGNVFMKRKEYQKAVEAYKEALRNDPTDEETRYNLALAKEMLKNDEEQNQQNQQNQDNKDQQDEQDQQDQNEDNKEGDNKEDNKDQEQNEEGDQGDEGDQNEEKPDENKEGDGEQKEEQNKQPEQGDQQEEEQPQQPRPNQLSKQQIQNLLDAMQNEEKKVQEKIDAQKVKGVKTKTEKDW